MNRNRRRERDSSRGYGGGNDGLLGEGPQGGSHIFEPLVNNQVNQLLLAQQLLQQQQAALGAAGGLSALGGGGDYGTIGALAGMQMLQQQQQALATMGGNVPDRKRVGNFQGRDDYKRRRRDSFGRSGDRDRRSGDGSGRDRPRSSRRDSDGDRGKKNKEYDPANPTEEEDDKDKDKDLYCHVCNVSVYDEASFKRHLNGMKHRERMSNVLSVHQVKSQQLKSRLKAEEHLRKIEGKGAGSFDADYFCKICNSDLTIPWDRHRYSNIHKQRQLQVKKGCGWCKVHNFSNFTEVLDHRDTEAHKENAEKHGRPTRSRSRERKDRRGGRSSRDRSGRREKKKVEEEEDLAIPEFDAEKPVGLNYIIPVTGFFCKLCHKFYNNEKSAKGAHCQSETHYEKFKLAIQAKIAEREKRKAEEAAVEAERKAKEEAEKKAKEENGEKDDDVEMRDGDSQKDDEDSHKDDEDFDDDLAVEDEDGDGGLAKVEATQNKSGSILDETSADQTFEYLDGAMAQAQLNLQEGLTQFRQATETLNSSSGSEECKVEDGEDDKMDNGFAHVDNVDLTAENDEVIASSQENGSTDNAVEDEDEESNTADVSQDEITATSTPAAEEKKGRRGGTARRGRGRGRAKK